MSDYFLTVHLLSDTTVGRGDGVAGLVDQEIEHDADGFPYIRGRSLKGLLHEECDNLLAVMPEDRWDHWTQAAKHLFGAPGSTADAISALHIGDACLPYSLRRAVRAQIQDTRDTLTPTDVLASLTAIRRQTAIDPVSGAPAAHSLRSARVAVRCLTFTAPLTLRYRPSEDMDDMLALLVAGTLAMRRLGSGRNRGRGHIRCSLLDAEGTCLSNIEQEIENPYLTRFLTMNSDQEARV